MAPFDDLLVSDATTGGYAQVRAMIRLANEACRLIRGIPPPLTPEQQECAARIRALPKDLTIGQVAERLGISQHRATKWCKRFHYRALTPKAQARALKLAELREFPPGLTIKAVAKRLGVPYDAALHRVHLAQYQFRRATWPCRKVPRARWRKVDWSKTAAEIAQTLGVSQPLVNHKRKELGMQSRPKVAKEIHQRLFAKLPAGLSIHEIAALLHTSETNAEYRCHQFGYKPRTKHDEIFALRQSQFRKLKPGLSVAQIARKLNISTHSAHRWTRALGYPLRRAFYLSADGRPLHEVMAEKFRKLPPGLTKRQLMKKLRRSSEMVRYWCKKFGYTPAERKR